MSSPETTPQQPPATSQSYTIGCLRFTPITETCVRVQQTLPGRAFEDAPNRCRTVAPERAGTWNASATDTGIKLKSPLLDFTYHPKAADTTRLHLSGLLINFSPERGASGKPPATPLRVFPLRSRPVAQGLQYRCRLALPGAAVLHEGRAVSVAQPLATGLGLVILDDTRPDAPNTLDLYFLAHGTEYTWLYRDLALLLGAPRVPPRWLFGALWDLPASEDANPIAVALARTCGVPLAAALLANSVPAVLDPTEDATTLPHYRVCVTLQRPKPSVSSRRSSSRGQEAEVIITRDMPGFDDVLRTQDAGGLRRSLRASCAENPRAETVLALDLADPHGADAFAKCVKDKLAVDGYVLRWRQSPPETVVRVLTAPPAPAQPHASDKEEKDVGDGSAAAGTPEVATKVPSQRPVVFGPPSSVVGNLPVDVALGGDVEARWELLRTLPSLVVGAAQARYPFWSVPVCGQSGERNDPELYIRWLQFAALCPILRFSLGLPGERDLCERRPWMLGDTVLGPARQVLQFRQSLIPFWHAIAVSSSRNPGLPIVRSMYVECPANQEAYHCPAQFMVGPGLLAAPFLTPADPALGLSHTAVWFPPGRMWHELFGTTVCHGGTWKSLYGTLSEIPLYACDGTIVPMYSPDVFDQGAEVLASTIDETENLPLDILVFPPSSGSSSFELFGGEDSCCTARVVCERAADHQVTVSVSQTENMDEERRYTLYIRGVVQPSGISIALDCDDESLESEEIQSKYSPDTSTLILGPVLLPSGKYSFVVKFDQESPLDVDALNTESVKQVLHKVFVNCAGTSSIRSECQRELFGILDKSRQDPADLGALVASALKKPLFQALPVEVQRVIFKVMCDVGFSVFDTVSGERHIVAWNQSGVTGVQLDVYPQLASALERYMKMLLPRNELARSSRSSLVSSVRELDEFTLRNSRNLACSGKLHSATVAIPLDGITSRIFQVYSRDHEGAVRITLASPLQEEAIPILSPQTVQREVSLRCSLRSSHAPSKGLTKSVSPLAKSTHRKEALSQSEVLDGTNKSTPPIIKTIVSTTKAISSDSPFSVFLGRFYFAPPKL